MLAKLAQPVEDRPQEIWWQGLRLVEDDDAACKAMELTAAARLVGEEAFKELNGRRYDDRGIPVFSRETRAQVGRVVFVAFGSLCTGAAVVLQYNGVLVVVSAE